MRYIPYETPHTTPRSSVVIVDRVELFYSSWLFVGLPRFKMYWNRRNGSASRAIDACSFLSCFRLSPFLREFDDHPQHNNAKQPLPTTTTNNEDNNNNTMVKVLAIAVVRTGTELPDPITCSMGSELSSFGFFQRPVSGGGIVYW